MSNAVKSSHEEEEDIDMIGDENEIGNEENEIGNENKKKTFLKKNKFK